MCETTILSDLSTVWVKLGKRRWEMIGGNKGVLFQDVDDKTRFKFRGHVVTAKTPTEARQLFASISNQLVSQTKETDWVSYGRGMIIVGDSRGRLYRNKNNPSQWRWKEYVFVAESPESAIDHLTQLRSVG